MTLKIIPINITNITHTPKPQPRGRELKKPELSLTGLDFKFSKNFSLLFDSESFTFSYCHQNKYLMHQSYHFYI